MTTRRIFLTGAAAASVAAAVPAVALASDLDVELLAAVAEYHRSCDILNALCRAEEAGKATAGDITACRKRNKAIAFRIAALPALTMAGFMAKTRIALEAITVGEAEWDEALADSLLRDIKRIETPAYAAEG